MRMCAGLRKLREHIVYPSEPKSLTRVDSWPVVERTYPAVMSGLTVHSMVTALMCEAVEYHKKACDRRNWWDRETVFMYALARDTALDAIDTILRVLDEQEPTNLEPLNIPDFINQNNIQK